MISRVMSDEATKLSQSSLIPWDEFEGRTFLVTGATGLIGKSLVLTLLQRSNIKIVALVRNIDKAISIFGNCKNLQFIQWEANYPIDIQSLPPKIDYVIHCANNTNSGFFITNPVDTILGTLNGTVNTIDIANKYHSRYCLLSTMETYGEYPADLPIKEDQGGYLNPMIVRNSYPEAKRIDEALVAAYCSQFDLQGIVLRLTQTFGPGVQRTDERVFAEFARNALEGNNIVLLTRGTKRNAYLYSFDAVSAILIAVVKGKSGEAYNAANDSTFCSILEMANLVAEKFGDSKTRVIIMQDPEKSKRFRKGTNLRLETSKLRNIGWVPQVELVEMYTKMIQDWMNQF